jgi:hypothetical protein
MASKEHAIEYAQIKNQERWESFDAATKAALAIAEDCNDRRGLHIDSIDEDLQAEIVGTWAEIIRQTLAGD